MKMLINMKSSSFSSRSYGEDNPKSIQLSQVVVTVPSGTSEKGPEDFEQIKVLSKGVFGDVYQVQI